MPTQTTDIFNAATPGIQYAGPGITWKIAKGVDVGSGTSAGILSGHANSKLVNKGLVSSDDFVGAWFQFGNTEVRNKKSGDILGDEVGLYLGNGALVQNVEVHNKGDIQAAAQFGLYAIEMSDLQVYNTGSIFGPVVGLYVNTISAATEGAMIDNAGLIHSNTYGIASVVPANLRTTIVNREDGVIEGDSAAIYATNGMIKLKNDGKIDGDIALLASNADDKVINKGKIKGDTYLGMGDDTFKNKDAKAKMLFGEEGNDTFIAGKTKDQIVFDTALNALTNVDTVKGFEAGKDQFYLDQTIFASLIGPGPLLASEFRKGNAAVDGDDYIVYNKGSGSLFYDPDGSGGAAQVKFAQVDKGTKLSHDDFMVIA